MDDLRAGLVAAGRAVSEAQQEAEAVKKAVAQQEAAMASKYGTSIDVLKRLGEVTCVPRKAPRACLALCRTMFGADALRLAPGPSWTQRTRRWRA